MFPFNCGPGPLCALQYASVMSDRIGGSLGAIKRQYCRFLLCVFL